MKFAPATFGEAIGLILTVVLSFGGAWTVSQTANATQEQRILALETQYKDLASKQERTDERVNGTLDELTKSIAELSVVLEGMRVGLTYMQEDIKDIKGKGK